jgi:hypothetical protein
VEDHEAGEGAAVREDDRTCRSGWRRESQPN